MSFIAGLKCRECGRDFPQQPVAGCDHCFAPLEVEYDYDSISRTLSRELIASRPNNLWRYRALKGGFYIFKHEYVMVFQKPARGRTGR